MSKITLIHKVTKRETTKKTIWVGFVVNGLNLVLDIYYVPYQATKVKLRRDDVMSKRLSNPTSRLQVSLAGEGHHGPILCFDSIYDR